jgi:glutamine amidotransferase
MAGFVEQMARNNGVAQSLWMTLGFTDGNAIYVVRYASDGDAPTLFHTDDTEHLYRLNKCLRGSLPAVATRLIVSEPIGSTAEKWTEVPQNTAVTFDAGQAVSRTFRPTMPS